MTEQPFSPLEVPVNTILQESSLIPNFYALDVHVRAG